MQFVHTGVVLLKGQAACEIDTADELLTAELMFNGTLIGLDKHQLVSHVQPIGESCSTARSKDWTSTNW
jgi:superfamily II RNA helicase